MFTIGENDTRSYKKFGAELGAAIGGYASLAMPENMILNFLVCLAVGYMIGLLLDCKY